MTPEGVEVPRSLVDEEMQEKVNAMPEQFRPALPKGPDCKWRYMWRVGPRPSNTRFKVLYLSFVSHLYDFIASDCYDVFFVGTKFRACDTRGFSRMERNDGLLGVQNDISYRGDCSFGFSVLWILILSMVIIYSMFLLFTSGCC